MKTNILSLKFVLSLLAIVLLCTPASADKPSVKVYTDKKEYIAGEDLNISLEPATDCNVLLIYITASGDTVRILPSGTEPDGRVAGGKTYETPATGDNQGLYISAPFGKEKLIVYATYADLPDIPGEEIGPGLYLIPGGEKQLDRLLPGASKAIWDLETFSKEERGRFRKSRPEDPIHMTGSAGQKKDIKDEGIK